MHWDTFKQDNYSTVEGDGGCRVGEVRAGTTSPMPDHKGFKLQDTRYKMILLSFHVYNYTYIRHISQDNSHDN